MAREVKYIDPTHLIIIGLDADEDGSPLNDERASWEPDDSMVRNIMVYGVQQPVLVRREAGKTYVVDGRQRVKAARVAATRQGGAGEWQTKVPCIEVQGDDGRVSGIMISANEIRKDDDVLTKAAKASRLLSIVGDKEEVALAFGRSTKTLDNWTKLLAAHPRVHEAIREGGISAAVGIKLSGLSREDQLVELDKLLSDNPGTSNEKEKEKTPTKTSSGGGSGREHPGIKKGWLRKAMKTAAFEELPEDDQDALSWFLTGHAPDAHWLEDFTQRADFELGTETVTPNP